MSPRSFALAVAVLIAVAAVLRPAALQTGFWLDDYAHLAMLDGTFPVDRSPFDLFNFSRGDHDEVQALAQAGFYPWFAHPELGFSMLRPLSSALIWLDHGVFGHAAVAFHVHSFLWLAALTAALGALLRRLFGAPIALVALLVLVVDEAPGLAIGWIANRNHLVSAVLGVMSLGCYVSVREHGLTRSWGATLAWYCAALAAGEYALCLLGYFVAYEACVGRGAVRARATALSVVVAPALAYLALRTALHYGSHGTEMYLDPFRETPAFLTAAWPRLSSLCASLFLASAWGAGLLLSALGAVSAAFGGAFNPVAVFALWLRHEAWIGALAIVFASGLMLVAVRGGGTSDDAAPRGRRLAWFAVGSALSLLPLLPSSPDPRLLVAPQLGWAVLVAAFLVDRWRALRALEHAAATRVVHTLLLVGVAALHLVLPATATRAHAAHAAEVSEQTRRFMRDVPLDAATLPDQRVVMLNVEPISAVYFSLMRGMHGWGAPRSSWVLNPSPFAGRLTRTAPDRLDLELSTGDLFEGFYARTFRARSERAHVGEVFALDGMKVTITAIGEAGPRAASFEFDPPLDAASWVFLEATPAGLQRVRIPAVGEGLDVLPMQPPLVP